MESHGFTCKRNIAYFHVLGLLKAKKHVLSEKNFPSVKPKIPVRWSIFVSTSHLKGYRIEILATLHHLDWINAPHTQNFEILKSLEET
jgi:hypothetical protein